MPQLSVLLFNWQNTQANYHFNLVAKITDEFVSSTPS